MSIRLGVGTDEVTGLWSPRGQAVFDGLSDFVGIDTSMPTLVDETARLIDEPSVAGAAVIVQGALELVDGCVAFSQIAVLTSPGSTSETLMPVAARRNSWRCASARASSACFDAE
jgi:hypothetical protein